MSARDAEKTLVNAALDQFAIPGDVGFPLNQAFEAPGSRQEAETLRAYLGQVRQEIAVRLVGRLYPGGEGPSKVSFLFLFSPFLRGGWLTVGDAVVVEFREAQVHGQGAVNGD